MLPPIDLLPHSILSKHYRSRQFSSRFIGVQRDWTPVPRASLNRSLLRNILSSSGLGQLVDRARPFPETLCRDTLPAERAIFFADASSRIWTKEFGLGRRNGTIAG